MLIQKTVGLAANGRQYLTPQAALDSIPLQVAASGNKFEILVYNDAEYTSAGPLLDFGNGIYTCSPECNITVRAAPGHSIFDNAAVQTNALSINQANGVLLTCTGYGGTAIAGGCHYAKIDGLQVRATANESRACNLGGDGVLLNRNLFSSRPPSSNYDLMVVLGGAGSVIANSVLVPMIGDRHALKMYGGTMAYNNTIVSPSDLQTGQRGIYVEGGSQYSKIYIMNNAIFGFNEAIGGDPNGVQVDGHNAVSNAALSAATQGSLLNLVAADHFVNATSTALDLRTKPTSTMKDGGGVTTYTDAINGTTRPSGASFDIGAWEIPQAATKIFVTGSGGTAGDPIELEYSVDGTITGDLVITPADGGADGTFEFATLTLNDAAPRKRVKYTKPTAGNVTITTTNNGGLANPAGLVLSFTAPPVVKTAYPTASSPGVRVIKVGPGETLTTLDALATYLATQNLKTNNERLIAEVYADQALGSRTFTVAKDQQDENHYCLVRPVPGYAQRDTAETTFDYGVDGLQISVSGAVKQNTGVQFEGFRITVNNGASWSLGGPNPNGFGNKATDICDLVANRIKLKGTGYISSGEYAVVGRVLDNLILREDGNGGVYLNSDAVVSRNTFASLIALGGGTGTFVDTAGTNSTVENNAFINVGPAPISGSATKVAGNYTNAPLDTARAGLTSVTGVAFVVNNSSDFLPAAGSPLLGNATTSANSILDAGGDNRGIDPDVGAKQRVAATALPSGAVTGTPKPNGQQLTIPFTTTGNPTGAMFTLNPDPLDPDGAMTNTAVTTLVAGGGTAQHSDIAPGNYLMTGTVSNLGGTVGVTGTVPIKIVGITGAPEAPPVSAGTADLNVPTFANGSVITPGAATTSTIAFSYPAASDNVGVAGYRISKSGDAGPWIDNGTSLNGSFAGLVANTSYPVRVQARDAAGNYSASLALSISTSAVVTPPQSSVTGVVVAPAVATGIQQFTRVVEGVNPSQAGVWSAEAGQISASGMFTPPARTSAVQTFKVRFTSDQDPNVWGEAMVVIAAIGTPPVVIPPYIVPTSTGQLDATQYLNRMQVSGSTRRLMTTIIEALIDDNNRLREAFNALAAKLDADAGVIDTDYAETLAVPDAAVILGK